jgi:hypothetical protein
MPQQRARLPGFLARNETAPLLILALDMFTAP